MSTIWNKKSSPTKQYTSGFLLTQSGGHLLNQDGGKIIIPQLVKRAWDKLTTIIKTIWH